MPHPLEMRLIHSAVYHPQTNGKLERAFRDDLKEYYRQRKKWIFKERRREQLASVEYPNPVRGHIALQGKPSSTRLQKQNFFALPSVLERLESDAWREHKTVGAQGRVRLAGRLVYIDPRLARQKIQLYETLEGMEVKNAAGKSYRLRNYRKELCLPPWSVKAKTRPY